MNALPCTSAELGKRGRRKSRPATTDAALTYDALLGNPCCVAGCGQGLHRTLARHEVLKPRDLLVLDHDAVGAMTNANNPIAHGPERTKSTTVCLVR